MKKRYFILAIIFCLFMIPKNAFALEIINNRPVSISFWTEPSNALTDTNLTTYGIYNTTFYGYDFNADLSTYAVSFNYNNDSRLNNRISDISFSVYTSQKITDQVFPFKAFIKDSDSNISSCKVDSSSAAIFSNMTNTTHTASMLTATCDNVFVNGPFSVVIGSDFNSSGNFSISKLTARINDINDQLLNESKKQTDEMKKQTEEQKKQNDFLNDDNVDDSKDKASNFFNDFSENNHGLSGLVNSPISLLQNLTTTTCTPLSFKLPMVDDEVSLPCLKPIYRQYFGVFFTLYQMMTTGLISYAVGIRLFAKVKGLQDPQNDKIEVFSL